VSIAVLALGSMGAASYARLLLPYYAFVDRLVASGRPWEITSIEVVPNDKGPGTALKLKGAVRREAGDPQPTARVIARIQVGGGGGDAGRLLDDGALVAVSFRPPAMDPLRARYPCRSRH